LTSNISYPVAPFHRPRPASSWCQA